MAYAVVPEFDMIQKDDPVSIIFHEMRVGIDEQKRGVSADEEHLYARLSRVNKAMKDYHASRGQQWASLSNIEERLRRVEQHLNLPIE